MSSFFSSSGMMTGINGITSAYKTIWNGNEIYINDKLKIIDNYSEIEITPDQLKSSFNDGKNVFAIIEALKQILIESNIISEEKFEEIYNDIQREYNEKINSYKVADALNGKSQPKQFNWDIDFKDL